MATEWLLTYLDIGLAIALIVRLMVLRLKGFYLVFSLYLLADVIGGVCYLISPITGWYYPKIWLWLQPPICILYVLLVVGLIRVATKDLSGIYKMSRQILIWSFAAALIIAGISARAEITNTLQKDWINTMVLFERCVGTVALLLLLVTISFLLWFPVPIARNVAVFASGFLVYFASKTVLLFAYLMWSADTVRLVSTVLIVISSVCLLYWVSFLSKAGETVKIQIGHRWKPEEQERLLGQLTAINATLLRSARRT